MVGLEATGALLDLERSTAALWDVNEESSEESSELLSASSSAWPHRSGAKSPWQTRGLRAGGLFCAFVVAGTLAMYASWPAESSTPVRTSDVGAEQVVLSSNIGAFLDLEKAGEGGALEANAPVTSLHDGNVCADDEEEFEGLCYKQCRLLTSGAYPVRTSSWSCYPGGNSSKIFNEKVGSKIPIPCRDFDVAGDSMGGGCPHSPGACLKDEEIFLDICYKKCSILTEGKFPHRVAAATCCKQEGIACFGFWNSQTKQEFEVGSGAGDHNGATTGQMHAPLEALTEKTDKHGAAFLSTVP
mmetsp:Transcript_75060/g.174064  ORF Transcript_75060/g.174064 Transcript_75060/m.174064 type:complete len:300 (+) Transcript_75060:67-966(+)|eukprot:CAMPEP_0171109800 /NCGR_PEP_ID=MMETSP0766_2-20121228/70987_1 /TAXON_ID=439317 /ORGANISM="Gambierdiscus australes, Strain CAWD 149" /LENGTH=299 /DNA_ID=CAMNT_0011571583 /DNA_START=66 /DNA_END=965 /DNA_ORIENTATION=-